MLPAKAALRADMARWTLEQSPDALRNSDAALFARFLALPQVKESDIILLFWGMDSEPDTRALAAPLLRQGKVIGLPRCKPGGSLEFRQFLGARWMRRHPMGMLEPDLSCPLMDPDAAPLALIPALCYDRRGYRLGRGGGFYDRFLTTYSGCSVGLCRAAQLQDALPIEAHDVRVSVVVTEDETFLSE